MRARRTRSTTRGPSTVLRCTRRATPAPKASKPKARNNDKSDDTATQPTADDAVDEEGAQNGLFDYLLGGEGK